MKLVLGIIGFIVVYLIFAGLQRRFSPHTLINGYMDEEKAKDICPDVFKKDKDNKN